MIFYIEINNYSIEVYVIIVSMRTTPKHYFLILLLSNISFAADDLIYINDFEDVTFCRNTPLLVENFDINTITGWNGLWQESGTSIDIAEVVNNEGRLVPLASNSPYSLARIYHPLVNAVDVEANFTFEFENASRQGMGLYVRSNGGHLVNTNPRGEGYVVFIERFSSNQSRLGLWYEHNGIETAFVREPEISPGVFYDFIDGVTYQVLFQVFQEDLSHTRLRAKIWEDGTPQPNDWGVSVLDDYIPLQNTSGAVAVDSFNSQSTGIINDGIRVDSIKIYGKCQF